MKIVKKSKSCRRFNPYESTKADQKTEELEFDLLAKIKIEPISPSKTVIFVHPKPADYESSSDEESETESEDEIFGTELEPFDKIEVNSESGSLDFNRSFQIGLLDCTYKKFGCEKQFLDMKERSDHIEKCFYRHFDFEQARRKPNCILNGKLVFADEMPEEPEE